jgi:hypothetical protein
VNAVTLRLTAAERAALTALAAGIGSVNSSAVTEEAAVVGAIELALTRLVDDFEIPDPAIRTQVEETRTTLRATWTRSASSL